MTGGSTHEFALAIPAPADQIFAALTTQSQLEQWFAEHVRIDAKPGGAFRFWGRHTAVGFDTFGTFYVTGAGPWNETEGRAVLSGSYADPVTGHAHDYEFLFTIHSPDHFTWTVVFLESGARVVAAEVEYRRR